MVQQGSPLTDYQILIEELGLQTRNEANGHTIFGQLVQVVRLSQDIIDL